MKRLFLICAVCSLGLFGCGGGDGGADGGGGAVFDVPVNVAGKWLGTMDHTINGVPYHYAVLLSLSQDSSNVTGVMILEYTEDGGHGGRIDGQMNGSHFTGTRTSRHVVPIEFDVTGDTLIGTFTFVSIEENLDEHGTFVCTRQGASPQASETSA